MPILFLPIGYLSKDLEWIGAYTFTGRQMDWAKLINYMDDALYYASSDKVREDFEISLKNRFNLTLLGEAKWYLGMRIKQDKDFISLDQDQYVKTQFQGLKSHLNILLRERTFHYQFLLSQLERIVLLLKNK